MPGNEGCQVYLPSVVGSWAKQGCTPASSSWRGWRERFPGPSTQTLSRTQSGGHSPTVGVICLQSWVTDKLPVPTLAPLRKVASEFPWTASFISHSVSPLQQGPSGWRLPLLLSTSPLPAHFPAGGSTEVSPALPSASARARTPPVDSDHSLPTPPASGLLQVRYPGHTDHPAVWL